MKKNAKTKTNTKTRRTKRRSSSRDIKIDPAELRAESESRVLSARMLKLRDLTLNVHMKVGAAVASLTSAGEQMRELCREIGMQHAAADDVEHATLRARIAKRSLDDLLRAVGVRLTLQSTDVLS